MVRSAANAGVDMNMAAANAKYFIISFLCFGAFTPMSSDDH